MANTEKEFLEWKVNTLNDQIGIINMILEEEEDMDAEDRKFFNEDIQNIKVWIKELKSKDRMKSTKKMEWKLNFLKERLDNVNMNLKDNEYLDAEDKEFLEEDAKNIKTWIKELRVKNKSIAK